jgi:hypothetical protein
VVLAVSAALGGIGVLLAFRALRRTLEGASGLLDQAGDAAAAASGNAIGQGIAEFLRRAQTLERALDEAERELETAQRATEVAIIRRRLLEAS